MKIGAMLGLLLIALTAGCSDTRPYINPTYAPASTVPPKDAIRQRILLIGDAGAPHPNGEPVLETLGRWASEIPSRTLLIFLGDNVYEHGVPAEESAKRVAHGGDARRSPCC